MIWVLGILISLFLLLCLLVYLIQDKVIFFPEPLPYNYSYVFPFSFKEYFLDEDTGGVINVLHFKPEGIASKGIVIYFHGNAGNLALWGLRAENFLSQGYQVVMYDYKGFGKSRGKRTEKSMYRTAEHVYQFTKTLGDFEQIVFYGISLGSGFATYLATKHPCDQLILETPYYSILSMGQRMLPFLPIRWLLKYHVRTDLNLPKVSCPITLIHGDEDELIPFADSLKLKKENPHIELITIQGGTHNDLDLKEEYHEVLEKTLQKKRT